MFSEPTSQSASAGRAAPNKAYLQLTRRRPGACRGFQPAGRVRGGVAGRFLVRSRAADIPEPVRQAASSSAWPVGKRLTQYEITVFILPTQESAQDMMGRLPQGPFVMLNLYRLRDVADYSAHPDLAPGTRVSGRELFDRYAAGMDRHLAGIGAKRVFLADAGSCLIGPSDERWDVVQMVRYPSLQAFMALMSKAEIQADLPHRFAMLEDSRVIPMIERSLG